MTSELEAELETVGAREITCEVVKAVPRRRQAAGGEFARQLGKLVSRPSELFAQTQSS
jgi:hypothetical protein